MSRLLLTRGLPASGKTTFAKAWVAEDPAHRIRANRDDLRLMLYGKPYGLTGEQEKAVTLAQHAMVSNALHMGFDVVVDDTNLNARFLKQWLLLAKTESAEIEWHDEFLDVDYQTCVLRDATRNAKVGKDVIISFWSRYLKNGKPRRPTLDSNEPDLSGFKPYHGTPGKPKAFLVDIDGTIASNGPDRDHPNRGYFDWHRVGEDSPVKVIIEIVHHFVDVGLLPIFVSGRDGVCRPETIQWVGQHVYGVADRHADTFELFMRPAGDNRKDSIIKLEIFDRYIRDNYDVQFALDDRNQVVKAYREVLGLTVLQVADGGF